jgi:tetratricopeptide (TPR) repeat protein
MKVLRSLTIVTLGAMILLSLGCSKQISFLKARNELNKGVQAFSAADYAIAATRFGNALELDPELIDARAYQAYAYMNQYIPGADFPENLAVAAQAIEGFQEVLDADPSNMLAVSSLASLYFNMKEFEKAEDWHSKRIELAMAMTPPDPGAAESYYTIGVIKWTASFEPRMAARAAMEMKPGDPGPLKDAERRREIAVTAVPAVDAGLDALQKALDVNPDYADAMIYLNLLERELADYAESTEEYEAHTAKANDWIEKAMTTKRRLAEEGTTEQFSAEK